MASHPYLDWPHFHAFAHRGGVGSAPENTMAAFQDAIDLGYVYLETDVHLTADGVVVAFHDEDLSRTCGVNARIEDVTWSELKDIRVNGAHNVPLLEEILSTWPSARINIDCKSDAVVDPLIGLLRRTNVLERICVGSFSDKRLGQIRSSLGDDVCTSLGPRGVARLLAATTSYDRLASRLSAHVAQVPIKQGPLPLVTKRFIETAHRVGLLVHVWTVDDPQEIARLIDLGVDGIMSDDTRALHDVLTARNMWPNTGYPNDSAST
ncbi:MAG: glycerophosphodiester phosphodiesterase [Actinobacteria bacterium]|nr:glycerophosphodiester phosphodiesterase [Actinomycetota bacterium]